MSQGLPTDNGHRFCEEALSTTECSVSVKQWCVRITRTFYIQQIFLIVPMVSNAYQGQLIKLNKRKHAWNPSVCWSGDIFYIIWNKVHRNSLFVFCKVVVITLQPALKIASIWFFYHQHTLRQKLSLPKQSIQRDLPLFIFIFYLRGYTFSFASFLFGYFSFFRTNANEARPVLWAVVG